MMSLGFDLLHVIHVLSTSFSPKGTEIHFTLPQGQNMIKKKIQIS